MDLYRRSGGVLTIIQQARDAFTSQMVQNSAIAARLLGAPLADWLRHVVKMLLTVSCEARHAFSINGSTAVGMSDCKSHVGYCHAVHRH